MLEEKEMRYSDVCPVHDEVNRRLDEIRESQGKEWETMDKIKDDCTKARESCQKNINQELGSRPTTGTLLTATGLILIIAIACLGLFSMFTNEKIAGIDNVMKTNEQISAIYRESMDRRVTVIERNVQSLVKHFKIKSVVEDE